MRLSVLGCGCLGAVPAASMARLGHDMHAICVGTPQVHGEVRADLTYVHAATAELTAHLRPGDVAGTSTVPPAAVVAHQRILAGRHGLERAAGWTSRALGRP